MGRLRKAIREASRMPAVGTTVPVYVGTATPGFETPGADMIWDFSAFQFVNTGITWTVVDPAATPNGTTFSTANQAWTLTGPIATQYFYFNITSSQFDVCYLDTFTDTYQEAGGSPMTSTVTYDAYGTLITPYATYTNVWRSKEDRGGNSITYVWQSTNPLTPILSYNVSDNMLTLFGNSVLSDVADEINTHGDVVVYPNPASDILTVHVTAAPSAGPLSFSMQNVLGQKVGEFTITSDKAVIDISAMSAGMYVYQLTASGRVIQSGTVVVGE